MKTLSVVAAIGAALALAACTSTSPVSSAPPAATTPAPVPEIRPGILAGYLQPTQLPDSLALVPPPPATDSSAFANDKAIAAASQKLRNGPRGQQAAEDAHLGFPRAAGTFSCALGVPIDEQQSPNLYRLLRRTLADGGLSTYAAKNKYQHVRPFAFNKQDSCTPDEETALRKDGSYPSGHTAIGWIWGMVLTEASPGQATALMARARSFGESRIVCNVHWQTDILQGRNMASATFARLQSDPTYQADITAARGEIEALRKQSAKPTRDCAAEATALAIPIPGVQ